MIAASGRVDLDNAEDDSVDEKIPGQIVIKWPYAPFT